MQERRLPDRLAHLRFLLVELSVVLAADFDQQRGGTWVKRLEVGGSAREVTGLFGRRESGRDHHLDCLRAKSDNRGNERRGIDDRRNDDPGDRALRGLR